MKLHSIAIAAAAFAAVALPNAASASLVYASDVFYNAAGFGNLPKDLTLQASGNDTFESGAVGVGTNGMIVFGAPIADADVFMGNGVTNATGTANLPNPLDDNQKYGIPTIGSLGITSASQIGIVFNGTEPAGNMVNVTDLTLKFYTSTGTLLGAIDGQQTFDGTQAGLGSAGYVFRVDALQQSYVNELFAKGGANTTLALEASITGVFGGPETFKLVNLGAPVAAVPEPETYALMLAGLGVMGFMANRRRKQQG